MIGGLPLRYQIPYCFLTDPEWEAVAEYWRALEMVPVVFQCKPPSVLLPRTSLVLQEALAKLKAFYGDAEW